jgi:hypothetical protein
MAADSMKHNSGQHFCFLLPDCDNWVVALEPFPVGSLDIDRHATEPMGPLDLNTEHVWMAGRDCRYPAQLLNGPNQLIVDVPVGIPEQVARRRLDEQCALADPDRRLDCDAVQAWLDFGDRSPVPGIA